MDLNHKCFIIYALPHARTACVSLDFGSSSSGYCNKSKLNKKNIIYNIYCNNLVVFSNIKI